MSGPWCYSSHGPFVFCCTTFRNHNKINRCLKIVYFGLEVVKNTKDACFSWKSWVWSGGACLCHLTSSLTSCTFRFYSRDHVLSVHKLKCESQNSVSTPVNRCREIYHLHVSCLDDMVYWDFLQRYFSFWIFVILLDFHFLKTLLSFFPTPMASKDRDIICQGRMKKWILSDCSQKYFRSTEENLTFTGVISQQLH